MIDSQALIKSPAKRASSDSEEDIPSSQPAPKCRPRTDEGFKTLRNRIAHFETRRSKTKKSLCVLKEHFRAKAPVPSVFNTGPDCTLDQTRPSTLN